MNQFDCTTFQRELDIQSTKTSLVNDVKSLIEKHQRKVLWRFENPDSFQEWPRVASNAEMSQLYLLFLTGMLPFTKLPYNAVQTISLTDSYKKILRHQYGSSNYFETDDGDNWKFRLRLRYLEFLDKFKSTIYRHLSLRKIMVIEGVPNTYEEYAECKQSDCIMTDRPELLHKYLRDQKQ